MATDLIGIEIIIEIAAWLIYGIFLKIYKDTNERNPSKEIFENIYMVSVIIAIIDLLVLAATIKFS